MPQKHNPVLSVLIRRAALTAAGTAATLHLAAATTVDERPDGAWHAEWATLRDLARRTVVAASQTTELLTGLASTRTDGRQPGRRSWSRAPSRRSMADLAGGGPERRLSGRAPS